MTDEKGADTGEKVTDTNTDTGTDDPVEVTESAGTDVEPSAEVSTEPSEESSEPVSVRRRTEWSRIVAFAVLPAVALAFALGAGYLKWRSDTVRDSRIAAATSMQAARDSTIALLSYTPDKVDQQLGAARDLLTGEFRDSYTSLTNDVVIPGAKQKQIAAVASVPAAASVSATPQEAVVLVFVNQTVTVGQDAPTDTNSSVRVTLEKVGDRWLISQFDPV
ncbi:MAG: hypothetical protein AB1925_02740 [Actinomycetota bacterium]